MTTQQDTRGFYYAGFDDGYQAAQTEREKETKKRTSHANGRRFLRERTKKARQQARRLWENETAQFYLSGTAAAAIWVFWTLAALKFFNQI